MRRSAAFLLSTMGLAVLLAAGAAYALDISCDSSTAQSPCIGTDAEDVVDGTEDIDIIAGLDSSDEIRGLGGPDRLVGNGTTVPGDDEVFGGPGGGELLGNTSSDLLSEGKGG
jgi:hypothetical protein